MPMAFCSRVAFPAFYQSLFTYFILLATIGNNDSQEAIVALAVIGIPLTARVNFLLVRERRKWLNGWLFSQGWILTTILPLVQLLLAALVS